MTETLAGSVLLPIGLGLLGFVEPCAVGAHLAVATALSARARAERIVATSLFVLVRALTMGLLGLVAAAIGQGFALTQKAAWLVFALAYLGLGGLYLTDRVGVLQRRLGPTPRAALGARDTVFLGVALGFAIPACAAPLLFAASGTAALGAGSLGRAFVAMALFGLALSAPLVLALASPRAAARLRQSAARGGQRSLIGWVLVAAGLWSVWFALFVDPSEWR